MTVRDLITSSLRKLGVLASGEVPSAEEASDALDALNSMIDSWKTERLMVVAILPETFPLVAGKLSYTMGPGGDFNTTWPARIDAVNLIYTQTGSPPLTLPITLINQDQYNAFIVPTTASSIPLWVYPDDDFPLRTLSFYTVPNIVNQVQIFTWQSLVEVTDLNTILVLPPGYRRALIYNLAVEVADEYGASVASALQSIAPKAIASKALVKSFNSKPLLLSCDPALYSPDKQGFNWLTGE